MQNVTTGHSGGDNDDVFKAKGVTWAVAE